MSMHHPLTEAVRIDPVVPLRDVNLQRDATKKIYTLWLFNIAMENGPFIDGLPIKNGDFPWLC